MIGSGRIVSILTPIAFGYLLDAGIGAPTLYQIFGGFMAMGWSVRAAAPPNLRQ